MKKIRQGFVKFLIVLIFISPFLFRGIRSVLPHPRPPQRTGIPQPYRIINAHEHFQSMGCVPKFLEAMKRNDVEKTVILGSPEATILSGRKGFFGEEKYNLEVLKIAKMDPEHFIAFPTINVKDPQKLEKLRQYLALGGQGLKLYSGNSMFHDIPLDDPGMLPVYEYCEKNRIPILFHVNAGLYQQEFENVLKQFPKLRVVCPHFCLSTIASQRFEHLMDTYPNLYTDASFGFIEILKATLLRISQDPEKFRGMVVKYQDRIFFGTDMIVTDDPDKTADWLAAVTRAYRDMLEKETYTFSEIGPMTLRGIHLDPPVLRKIYRTNFEHFFYDKTN